ncbi:MAG TPA: exodeoxyribonuclease VII small subunit [Spongiibacteraceae bacterium]|nr:exodeoxyribonuclease VII small subunit [Spongiibacteraceae bacterium]HCS27338.1 exodeoxyribonuclease VII small subunit [Spongiibacteraceae bacterium]
MAKAKNQTPGKQSFEESIAELEAIVERMESGELSLEGSLEAFESGMRLSREAQAALAAAELKVQQLTEQQGELRLQDFDTDE